MVDRYRLSANYLPCDDEWPLKNLPQWPHYSDFVFADALTLLPLTVMKAAEKSGTRLLLAGYYGDVLFTGGLYWALDMIRGKRLGLLAKTIFENRAIINWRQDIFDFGLRQLVPFEAVRRYRRWRPRDADRISPFIHSDLVARTDLGQRLMPTSQRARFPAPGQWHRYHSLTLNIFSQGITATRDLFNRYRLEQAQPYFDRRRVEFVMAVPAEELGRPDHDRRLARHAMRGLLPEPVRMRTRHTVFTPLLLKGLRDREKETVRSILSDPLVVERKYIDGDWLQKQLQKDFDLSDESMRLWFALSLELWLQRYWN